MRTRHLLQSPASSVLRPAAKRRRRAAQLQPHLLSLAAAMLLGPLAAVPASALVCVWNPASGNWGSGSDWSCSVVPTAGNADTATIGVGKIVSVNDQQSPGVFRSTRFLNNAGTVNLDAFGLTLGGGGSTVNTGTINVGGVSTAALQVISGHDIDNTGGTLNIANGSVLNQFGGSITGGTIATTGTGKLVVFNSSSNILSGLSFSGTMDMATNANARQRISNGLTLNGAVDIANGGILSLDSTSVANQTIGGNGTFNLNDAGARLAMEGNGSTTLGANVVVRGQGSVGQPNFAGGNHTLVNNGRISADVSGGTLSLAPIANVGPIINNNVLDARNGGILLLSTHINNTAGQINAGNGSIVRQNGITITSGTLGTIGTGVIQAVSSASNFLDGVTLSAGSTLDMAGIANSRNRIINSATINGAVNIGNGGILSLDSSVSTGGNVVVGGNGVINLNDAGARLAIEGNVATSALGANLTVRGQGSIGQPSVTGGNNVLTNNGLISADISGGTLNIVPPANSGSFVNNGTLQAVSGGRLLLSTDITANSGSQIIAGAGSSVEQNGARISGVINASGTGVFTANSSASNFLDGVNFSGTLDVASIANGRERFINGATINGAVNIAGGGIVSLDSSAGAANQIIDGNATFNLNDPGARLAIEGNGSTILGANVVVRGQGSIGQPNVTGGVNVLTNNGLISADIGSGTLNLGPPGNTGSFVNNGTLRAVNGGTLLISTHVNNATGQINAGNASAVVQNGVTITGGTLGTAGTGVIQANSSGSNFLDGVTLSAASTLDLTGIANSRSRIINSATIDGAVNIGNGGILSLDSLASTGNNVAVGGSGVINLNDAGARLAIEGSGTVTLGANVVVRGLGQIGQPNVSGGTAMLINNGRISADVGGGTLNLVQPGNSGAFTNNSVLDARSGGTLLITTSVNNAAGQINALNGSKVVQNGATITGGTLGTIGTGVIQAVNSASNFLDGVTLSAGSTLDMAGIANSRNRIINSATINGAVNIGNGGILSLDSSVSTGGNVVVGGTGVVNLNDAGARLAIEGNGASALGANLTVRGQGSIGQPNVTGGNNVLSNNGLILADGGTLSIVGPANSGSFAGTGTLQVSGGTLNVATGSASTQGKLVIGATGSLGLGAHNLTLSNDYTNAQAGTGNTFDRRAGVSGTGQILAAANASQAITGTGVSGGNTNNTTLTIGNVRVGANTVNYQIGNAGSTGPTLRGAIQTNVNGASLNDARLSGAGVTASNYNAGAPGGNSGNLGVIFTAASAGALAPLSGQVINLRSNFDNIADQKLTIVLAGGAAAYNAAFGNTTPAPVAVANQRVGGSNSTALIVSNQAATGAFSEDLNAAFGASTGAASTNGGTVSQLVAGGNNGAALRVGVDTSVAGARSGTVSINYQSNGTVGGTSNGLGVAGANGPQVINVSGNVYQVASGQLVTTPLNFGTVQVGQSVSQALQVANSAAGPAGFVEDLNASFGAATGTGAARINGSGSLSGITAGNSSNAGNGAMSVLVDTSSAGSVNGSIAVNYFSAGAVGGVSNGLGALAVGSQGYGVQGTIQASGNVINQASPQINNPVINLGAVRVGAASPTANISVTNVATVAPQAALNASILPGGGPITASGSFSLLNPGATNAGALQVALATGTAGNYTGVNAAQVTVQLISDASNVGNCAPNCQLNLASQTVSVAGKVYAVAVGQTATAALDFGVVRVGDTVSASNIVIDNTAAVQGLNDTLRGNAAVGGGPFIGGSVAGVAAQSSGQIAVGLNTSSAGVFGQNATVSFVSQNPDLADVSAGGSAMVALAAQINNLANGDFGFLSGIGTLSNVGSNYLLDLGTLAVGDMIASSLQFANRVTGPADDLSGMFDLINANDFNYAGFNAINQLAAGQAIGGFNIDWLAASVGMFSDTVVFNGRGTNASDLLGLAQTRQLTIRANVVSGQPGMVPEPGSLSLLLAAALAGLLTRGQVTARRARSAA